MEIKMGIKIRILAFILVALLIPLAVPASGAASVQLTAFTGVFSVDSAAYLARGGSDYGYLCLAGESNGAQRQALYKEMKEACDSFTVSDAAAWKKQSCGQDVCVSATVSTHGLGKEDTSEVFAIFLADSPQYFWLRKQFIYAGDQLQLLSDEAYSEPADRRAELEEILKTLCEDYQLPAQGNKNCYGILSQVYRQLVDHTSYATVDGSGHYSTTAHSVAGPLVYHEAVCEGYAKTLQLLMNLCGIENAYVVGTAGGSCHAWNMARMEDGQWYLLDATWENKGKNPVYFLSGNDGDHKAKAPWQPGTSYFYPVPALAGKDYIPPDYQGWWNLR